MAIKTMKATTRLAEGLMVESESRGFKVTMDEPVTSGGTDKGMTPMEMILCGLGGCQTITAAGFAESLGIDMQEFWVEIEGDLERPVKKGTKLGFGEIRYKMHIKTNASEDKVLKFAQFIEKSCPVGDTLMNPVKFSFTGIIIEK